MFKITKLYKLFQKYIYFTKHVLNLLATYSIMILIKLYNLFKIFTNDYFHISSKINKFCKYTEQNSNNDFIFY